MKTEHFPSFALCKKLKEIGFPDTTDSVYRHWRGSGQIFVDARKEKYFDYPRSRKIPPSKGENVIVCPCPSVMEMLDVMPRTVNGFNLAIWSKVRVGYYSDNGDPMYWEIDLCPKEGESLSDTMARMILWLHENKHISFEK